MSLDFRITVAGVGGAGGQCVQRLVDDALSGVRCIAVNTDWTSLALLTVPTRLRIGTHLTRGLGAGGRQELGARAAEDACEAIRQALDAPDLAFVVAGLGGGTGTGAAPVVARIARETGAVVVAVATLPYTFEGQRRRRMAEEGMAALLGSADTLLLIPADAALPLIDKKSSLVHAFHVMDEYVSLAVRGVAHLFRTPGLLLVDWAEASSVLVGGGLARFGFGEAEGERRAVLAAERALACPLLGAPLSRAAGLIVNRDRWARPRPHRGQGGRRGHRGRGRPDPRLVYGCVIEDAMAGRVRVSLLATGLPVGSIPVYRLVPGADPQVPFWRAT